MQGKDSERTHAFSLSLSLLNEQACVCARVFSVCICINTLNDLQQHECVTNPWWDISSSKLDLCVLQALNSRGLALCNAASLAFDLIAMSLSATELGAGVTDPLWDAYWDCVWRARTSPEVEGEKGLPLWWCTHLWQHKCQVSPSCWASRIKCPCIREHFANAFIRCSFSMKLHACFKRSLLNCTFRWHRTPMWCPRFCKGILANCFVKRNSC